MTIEELLACEPKANAFDKRAGNPEGWNSLIVLYGRPAVKDHHPYIGVRDGKVWYSVGGVPSMSTDPAGAGLRGPFTDLGMAYTSFRLEVG